MTKRKGLRATRPNLGVEVQYQRKLTALVEDMHRSVKYFIFAEYRANKNRIMAMDARPANLLTKTINKLISRWQKKFDNVAESLANNFANSTKRNVDNTMANAAKRAGMTVKFKPTKRMQDAYASVISEQVNLIKSIPTQYLTQVQTHVMQSVQTGRDLGTLSKNLEENFGVTKRRAALIARDQNNKATSVLTRVRQLEVMGEDAEAEWIHSGAGRHPRPDHVASHGKVFKVSKGCLISGEYIFPGEKIRCRCTSRLLLF